MSYQNHQPTIDYFKGVDEVLTLLTKHTQNDGSMFISQADLQEFREFVESRRKVCQDAGYIPASEATQA